MWCTGHLGQTVHTGRFATGMVEEYVITGLHGLHKVPCLVVPHTFPRGFLVALEVINRIAVAFGFDKPVMHGIMVTQKFLQPSHQFLDMLLGSTFQKLFFTHPFKLIMLPAQHHICIRCFGNITDTDKIRIVLATRTKHI